MDHRIDDAGTAEVEWPRRSRIGRAAAPIGGGDLAISRARHPHDAATQLIEHGELAQAPRNQLELFAILAIDGVLYLLRFEQDRLESTVEQQRKRDSLIGIRAKQRKRRAECLVAIQEIDGDLAQSLHRVAELLKVAPQMSGNERPQLPQVWPNELLRENQDVVLQQTEELQAALLFAVEHIRRARGELRHLLARLRGPTREDAVLERIALCASGLRVDRADASRHRREMFRKIE